MKIPAPTSFPRTSAAGIMLLECLVYIVLFALILGTAFAAFYRTLEHSTRLHANAADISRALHAGERWRDEVRAARGPLQVVPGPAGAALTIPGRDGNIHYRVSENALMREDKAGREQVLGRVKRCEFIRDPRPHVLAWRWEVELEGKAGATRVSPMFSFLAVPAGESKP